MSGPPFITIDEFDGTQGYVKTKGFVNREIDLPCHKPRQKVFLGDSELEDVQLPASSMRTTSPWRWDVGTIRDRVNLSMIPPDGVSLQPHFRGWWIDVTETV